MNGTVFTLTLRQFVGQRRSLLLVLLAAVPVIMAAIYQLGDTVDQHDWTVNVLLDGIVITSVLPLACLILGVSALGSEVEDGTAVYILAKPVPRADIILAKFAAAALVAAATVVPSALVSGLLALDGVPAENLPLAFAAAALLGVAAYTALFVFLSVATSRSLVFGLGYVFLWEGLVTELFSGMRWVSVRQYCLGVADLISPAHEDILEANLDGGAALALIAFVTAAALYLATRRLQRLEITAAD